MEHEAPEPTGQPDDDAIETLARAVELFEKGDYHDARRLAQEGRKGLDDSEALAEADALLDKLKLDRVPMIAALGLLTLVLLLAAIAAS